MLSAQNRTGWLNALLFKTVTPPGPAQVTAAVEGLWAGERDLGVLTAGLDEGSARLVALVLFANHDEFDKVRCPINGLPMPRGCSC